MAGHDEENKSAHGGHSEKAHGAHGGGHAAGGGGHDEEEHSGAPEWLISFADNTALLMGFFVIMLALAMAMKGSKAASSSTSSSSSATTQSSSNEAIDFALGVGEAFNNPVSINSTKPGEQQMVQRLKELYGADATDDSIKGKHLSVQSINRGKYFNINALVLFDARHTDPTPDSHAQIAEFANRAKGLNLVIEVRGHTSTNEIEGDPRAAMQLSYEGAFQVAQELVTQGVPWNRIHLMAIGATERDGGEVLYPDRKAQNQRVELILTSDLAKD